MIDSRNSQDLENYNGVAVFVRAGDGTSLPVGPDNPLPMSTSAISTSSDGARNSEDLERYNGVALFVRGADGRSYPVGPEHPLLVTGDGLGGGGGGSTVPLSLSAQRDAGSTLPLADLVGSGTLLGESYQLSGPGEATFAAVHPAGLLTRGGAHTEATVRLSLTSATYARGGLLLNDQVGSPRNAYFVTLESADISGLGSVLRVLQYANGALGALPGDPHVAVGLDLAEHAIGIRLTADGFVVSLDGTPRLTVADARIASGYIGAAAQVPSGVTNGVRVQGVTLGTPQLSAGDLPPDVLLAVRRGGRPGLVLATLTAGLSLTAPTTSTVAALVTTATGELREAAPPLLVSGGAVVSGTGQPGLGAVVGLAELATDPAMRAWVYIHESDPQRGVTTVDPATRTITMTTQESHGYAYQSRMAFDPGSDVTLEFRASLSQLQGTKAWLGGVLYCSEYNYAGVNVTRGISTGQSGVIAALYGDEQFADLGAVPTAMDEEHLHTVTWDARAGTISWAMDGVTRASRAWTPRGAIIAWIGSVAVDATTSPGQVSSATYRDVRCYGSPVWAASSNDGLLDRVTLAAGQSVVVDRTPGTGRDYVSGAGAAITDPAPAPDQGWGGLLVGGSGTLTVQVCSASGTPLPDVALPGNSAGFAPGLIDVSGVDARLYPLLRAQVTLAENARLWEVRWTRAAPAAAAGPETLTLYSAACGNAFVQRRGFRILPIAGSGGAWDNATHEFVAPATGTYQVAWSIRMADVGQAGSVPAGSGLGHGVDTLGPWFIWGANGTNRTSLVGTQTLQLTVGQRLPLVLYVDADADVTITSAQLDITRLS